MIDNNNFKSNVRLQLTVEQCCNHSKQLLIGVAMLCCAENRHCKSSCVRSADQNSTIG